MGVKRETIDKRESVPAKGAEKLPKKIGCPGLPKGDVEGTPPVKKESSPKRSV